MRLAVAGKGGSGKTTISATIARTFARMGYRVSAIDDDPNPNLADALGLSPADIARLKTVPRSEVLEEGKDEEGNRTHHLLMPFEDVIDKYGVHGPDGVGVLMMTGIVGAGAG
ncbi:MAG: AAA family ATPase [Armatimonadetes bacterium]|nr:AAA family ATPase [Candidatus Dependentiae bacterium]MBA3725485.1 AAA family ATPase [Armatimonadota bacterium]